MDQQSDSTSVGKFMVRHQDGTRSGPLTTQQLKALAQSGRIQPGDMVLKQGSNDWRAARLIRGLLEPVQPQVEIDPEPISLAPETGRPRVSPRSSMIGVNAWPDSIPENAGRLWNQWAWRMLLLSFFYGATNAISYCFTMFHNADLAYRAADGALSVEEAFNLSINSTPWPIEGTLFVVIVQIISICMAAKASVTSGQRYGERLWKFWLVILVIGFIFSLLATLVVAAMPFDENTHRVVAVSAAITLWGLLIWAVKSLVGWGMKG